MMENKPIILDGKKVADEILSKIPNQKGKELAIITIGEDEASKVYVRNKIKAAEKVGLKGVNYKFNEDKSNFNKVISKIIELNHDPNVIGIMVQKPYPEEFNQLSLEELISVEKDVDGLSYKNMYFTLKGWKPYHYPATPEGILTLLNYYKIPIEGKNVVIIGRSDIVGKPLAAMMTARNATVTLCHSKTKNLERYTQQADIIVSAVGKPKFIDKSFILKTYINWEYGEKEFISNYPVIIDVGINRDENGKLCGDIDFDDVLPFVSAITPVPGGVGPMTVCGLIKNCCKNAD